MSLDLVCQKAVLDQLKAHAPLAALVSSRVYDYVPQKPTFPFVNVGEDALAATDTSTSNGASIAATIHTWSGSRGRKECKQIQSEIRAALHTAALSAAGFVFEYCLWSDSQSFIDADGVTRHGVCVYDIYLREI